MANPTKKQLIRWRSQGMTNVEISIKTGRSLGTINMLFSKYKIPCRRRALPKEQIDTICRMRISGISTAEIAEKIGCSHGTVCKYIKAAGLIPDKKPETEKEQELPVIFADQREPRIEKVIIKGKNYIDITDLWIPG